jgi:cytochrome c peroxidase
MYSAGMATLRPKPEQADDPLFPQKSPLLQRLDLTAEEKRDLLAFLDALTERRRRVRAPELPPIGDHAP